MRECRTCKHLTTEHYCRLNPAPSFSGEHLWCKVVLGEPPTEEREAAHKQGDLLCQDQSCAQAEPWQDPHPDEVLSTEAVEHCQLEAFYLLKRQYPGSGGRDDGIAQVLLTAHVLRKTVGR